MVDILDQQLDVAVKEKELYDQALQSVELYCKSEQERMELERENQRVHFELSIAMH
jgi:hypothetical protein